MSSWMQLSYFTAIALMIVILGTAFVVLYLIIINRIDLSTLLEEADPCSAGDPGPPGVAPDSPEYSALLKARRALLTPGKASLSRFQFLLFTFVIAGLFLMLSVESGTFVTIPDGVLALMGISAGSYAVSKGITANSKGKAESNNAAANYSTAAHAAKASAAASAAAAHAADAKAAAESARKPT